MNGIDRFIFSNAFLKGIPLGILTNHATFAGSGYPVAVELIRAGFTLKKFFSPEHGVSSQGEDGKFQNNQKDRLTGLQVTSLYGEHLFPLPDELNDIDAVLVDLPNIGCRFYTYWWTITYMAEACARAGKKMILLDRPNLSARSKETMEGPLLDEVNCSSFLGRWTMPLTYSYSYGQLLSWFIYERLIPVSLEIIHFDDDAIQKIFLPPSPAMPDQQTVQLYPFTGLFEGLNLNSGRGTSFPFKVLGAPWIDSLTLHNDFMLQNFEGIQSYPYTYKPAWSVYQNEYCHGLYFHVTDSDRFLPVQTGIWLMNYLSVNYPNRLSPQPYPTAVNPSGKNHLDMLMGIPNAFNSFCSGTPLERKQIQYQTDVGDWVRKVELGNSLLK